MIAIILWLADFYYNIPRRRALQAWEQRENRNYEKDLNSHLAPRESVFDDLNFFRLQVFRNLREGKNYSYSFTTLFGT